MDIAQRLRQRLIDIESSIRANPSRITDSGIFATETAADVTCALTAMVESSVPEDINGASVPKSLGIVGAQSVPTSLWPYLLVATCLDVPVTLKVAVGDIPGIHLLAEVLQSASKSMRPDWTVTTVDGRSLLDDGYWDQHERLLVFGASTTTQFYKKRYGEGAKVVTFGHCISVMFLCPESMQSSSKWEADFLAFQHTGCLAPRLVISPDSVSFSELGLAFCERLTNRRFVDIAHQVGLRQVYQGLRAQSRDCHRSPDGMWLFVDGSVPHEWECVPGLVCFLKMSDYIESHKLPVGATALPDRYDTFGVPSEMTALASYLCGWGHMQFPPLTWENFGFNAFDSVITKIP